MTKKNKIIAIAGNPNCGKTVIFNALTGSRQKIGNWSGVTVEKKSGSLTLGDQCYEIIDLPGTYSLSVVSDNSGVDECIACNYLLSNPPDMIINVVDASNLERQLYLSTQLLEMRLPVIIALNMMDIAKRRGIHIDVAQLSQSLGCPVIPLTAIRGKGLAELRHAFTNVSVSAAAITYPLEPALQTAWETLSKKINGAVKSQNNRLCTRWLALRLLEDDNLAKSYARAEERSDAKSLRDELRSQLGEEPDLLIADARYRWIQSALKQSIKKQTYNKTFTSSIDRFILNRWLGIPIFLLVMYSLFLFAINVGGAFQDFFDIGSTAIFIHGTITLLNSLHLPAWLIALIANGFGKGINTTISFIPVIGAMFLFLSLLEDSGYMARAAFVIDRLMAAVGLPGKAFVPLIVGFGCNVPTVMATRTLASPRDRILTVMMAPFMSCGARLTVYVLFVSAFFPHGGALIIFALYIIGIITAILTAFLLGSTTLKAENTPMILELPTYHWPHWRTIFMSTWQRLKLFLIKAGRFIIPICMLIGFLNAVSIHGKLISGEANQNSLLSSIGKTITPVFYPIGIQQDNWPATVGLAGGLLAKEVVVGTLNTLYSQVGQLTEEDDAANILTELKTAALSVPKNLAELKDSLWNPMAAKMAAPDTTPGVYGVMSHYFDCKIGAFAYLLFILLYFPCISTMAVMQREIGRSWAYFSMAWSTGIAYAVATVFYQTATFMQHPLQSLLCFLIIGLTLIATIWALRYKTSGLTTLSTPSDCSGGGCHG
ncbi:Fe(2+) transporter permease subunit FeoB [Rickettsiella endosymbiont of Dermanyssus gallinae]|uniref:Fe(2+) transporter permease subunit FeoB n=1 Tax=Rickettsiella endosymbiont of Dermanyssus gallinae TaxID=2856608 RepID=UPI001C528672|nr:Fe(2+) transporter permease subunit FeoB [Rickettsiella endosymbiont of Dermanyssus gallinae]